MNTMPPPSASPPWQFSGAAPGAAQPLRTDPHRAELGDAEVAISPPDPDAQIERRTAILRPDEQHRDRQRRRYRGQRAERQRDIDQPLRRHGPSTLRSAAATAKLTDAGSDLSFATMSRPDLSGLSALTT